MLSPLCHRTAWKASVGTAGHGAFQASVSKLLGFPMLLPTRNSVGAEIGKSVAPQTASVVVSTTQFVRNKGAVIPRNIGCTFVLRLYLVLIGWLPTCTS